MSDYVDPKAPVTYGHLQVAMCEMREFVIEQLSGSKSPDRLLTSSEAATFLGIHTETMRLWAKTRKISYCRLGKADNRFRQSDLNEFVESRLNYRRSAFPIKRPTTKW
jgi:excisionase family DNA binding protein